jgi:hypothetical protein
MRAWLGSGWIASCAVFMPHHPGAQTTPPDAPLTVTISTRCEAMVPTYCQGRFGFKIMVDGSFVAGPDPDGHSASGYLRNVETDALRTAAERVVEGVNVRSVECHIRPEIPGVSETVAVLAKGRTVILRGASGRLGRECAPGNAVADARLFELADRLMHDYYPKPFAP